MQEYRLRSIIKAVTWRVSATLTTMLLVFIFTGQMLLSLGVGAFEVVTKLALYYFHERLWNQISWGKLTSDHATVALDQQEETYRQRQ